MRELQKTSTALCNLTLYSNYLFTVPVNGVCTKLANSMETMSHDAILNQFVRENYVPYDLFLRSKSLLNLVGGTLSCDDSILDKPYSDATKSELIGRHYSGKHHAVVQGICLVTLFYTDLQGHRLPVNYRIYLQGSEKTKNDWAALRLFAEMLAEVLDGGLQPKIVTVDTWYASLFNLKLCRKYGLDALFAVAKDRQISTQKGHYEQVSEAVISEEGLFTHLKAFDGVTVFRTQENGQARHYVYYQPPKKQDQVPSQPQKATQEAFEKAHKDHWHIEQFHRAIKQLCNIEKFMVRRTIAVTNHIFPALWAFITLEEKLINKMITNWYQFRENIITKMLKENIM